MREVEADFDRQLATVKNILSRWFAAEFEKNGVTGALPNDADLDLSDLCADQVVGLLVGDDTPGSKIVKDASGAFEIDWEGVPESAREFVMHFSKHDAGEAAHNLMTQDKNLRRNSSHASCFVVMAGPRVQPKRARAHGHQSARSIWARVPR